MPVEADPSKTRTLFGPKTTMPYPHLMFDYQAIPPSSTLPRTSTRLRLPPPANQPPPTPATLTLPQHPPPPPNPALHPPFSSYPRPPSTHNSPTSIPPQLHQPGSTRRQPCPALPLLLTGGALRRLPSRSRLLPRCDKISVARGPHRGSWGCYGRGSVLFRQGGLSRR